jgi:hypothetical protein
MVFRIANPIKPIVFFLFLGSATLFVPILAFSQRELVWGLVFLAPYGWFLFILGRVAVLALVSRLVIGEGGVESITLKKRCKMSWDEIHVVGIGYDGSYKYPWKPRMIYFSADGISAQMIFAEMVNDRFFVIDYRHRIVDEIRKSWPYEIDGLDNISHLEKLIKHKKKPD